jgi:hypothetical protein
MLTAKRALLPDDEYAPPSSAAAATAIPFCCITQQAGSTLPESAHLAAALPGGTTRPHSAPALGSPGEGRHNHGEVLPCHVEDLLWRILRGSSPSFPILCYPESPATVRQRYTRPVSCNLLSRRTQPYGYPPRTTKQPRHHAPTITASRAAKLERMERGASHVYRP